MIRKTFIYLLFLLAGALVGVNTGITAKANERKLHIPVIPTAFADTPFGNPESGTILRGRLDSLETYFNSQLGGPELKFIICSKVSLRQPLSYYGADSPEMLDALIYKAVIESVTRIDDETQFDLFDNASSGCVDCIVLYFAGRSQERSGIQDGIWPQYSTLEQFNSSLALDGRRINAFCAFSQDDLFGTMCHEIGHMLGLVDLYDTDGEGSGGLTDGIGGCNSLMDRGRHNDGGSTPSALSSIDLEQLESGREQELTPGSYSLQPLSHGGKYLKVSKEGSKGEFFLIENRFRDGWDGGLDGDGLLVYHIDRSNSPAGWSDYYRKELSAAERWRLNQVNCRPDRMLAAALLPQNYGQKYFRESIGLDEASRLKFYDGSLSALVIDGIGFDNEGNASFEVYEGIVMEDCRCFQDAVMLSWKANKRFGEELYYKLYVYGPQGAVKSIETNQSCATVEGLEAGVDYEVEIYAVRRDGRSVACRMGCKTKTRPEGLPAYIYLASAEKNVDGSFRSGSRIPLRVVNLESPAKVEWFFDGQAISPEADGWYVLSVSGELKAVIHLPDGSNEVIIRNLRVR